MLNHTFPWCAGQYLGQDLLLIEDPGSAFKPFASLLVLVKARISETSSSQVQLTYISTDIITTSTEMSAADSNKLLDNYPPGKVVKVSMDQFWGLVAAKQLCKVRA